MSFLHQGPWDAHSRQSRTLRFVEAYTRTIDSLAFFSSPATAFYAPLAIFHDQKGEPHLGGSTIWSKMHRLFAPFSRTFNEVVELRVVPSEEGRVMVYAEFLTHFWLKGDSESIVAPRFFVWTIGEAVDGGGTEGLQIVEARCFWDTGILGRYVTDRNKRRVREREQVDCAIEKEILMVQ